MRLRLAISIAVGTLFAWFATSALAEPLPTSPGPDAVFVADGKPIGFGATVDPAGNPTPPGNIEFRISSDGATSNEALSNYFYRLVSGGPTPPDGVYSAGSNPDVLGKPGEYFWQPVDLSAPLPTDQFGSVQRFVISPLPASAVTSASQVDTFLNKKPRHRTRHRKVKFTFSSNVDGAKFQCLFATGWEKCRSPHVFRHLKVGRYQFEVRAVVNGIEDTDPETWLFRVLRRHH
jgi:hypothetical protein